jgi:hypothetical protein
MKRVVLTLLLLLAAAVPARAQTTRERLDSAKLLYQSFEVERARPILQGIVSPGYLQPVSPTERVEAYKYLGASYALVDKRDSAASFFVAALDFDPFTDLDPQVFSASEIGAFADAKRRIFKIGIRPIDPKIVDPRQDTSAYNFRVMTTHVGDYRVELLNRDSTVREVLYQGRSGGERRIAWRGILTSTGQIADSGVYQIRVIGQSAEAQNPQESREIQFFRLEHHYEFLEKSLPPFTASDTLQSQIPARAPWGDLAKGVVIGALAAVALPVVASLDETVKGYQTHAVVAGGALIGSGIASFLYRRRNRNIQANVQENARRKRLRDDFNRDVDTRNRAKLDQRLLIITPASGFTR